MILFDRSLQVHYILPGSRSNGPGLRYTIWTQGCSIHCPDCSNKATWDPKGGSSIKVRTIIKAVEKALKEPQKGEILQGVTITGGEPLDQPKAVYDLCKELFPLTSIFLTTGYMPSDIFLKRQLSLLDYIDILCTGPFRKDEICSNQWKGSSNQEIAYLTDRGRELSKLPVVPKEVFINPDGSAIETGFTV